MIKLCFHLSLSSGYKCELSCIQRDPPVSLILWGKNYIFQLKLGKFNFTSKHQTFTIPRIITEKQRPPLPDFFIHVGT
ncbi:hypothetical protein Bca4012_073167 [Brassica carinata]|uniref:Uncharacterized protein n=1 Tax=Brassica carinata TaxID=52824 RepID=A0A8X7QIV7_BRACI|nr:hypothetical protein Bca52824_065492 [Brassica carinata]